jgi:hypothetical protein
MWTRNGSPQAAKVKITALGRLRAELSVADLRREDYLSTLACEAQNNDFQKPIATKVTVDMNRKEFRLLGGRLRHKIQT